MISNKKLNKMVTELFIIERKLNISTVFITQSYFAGPKNVTLNCIRFIIMRNLNKQERQQTAFNLHQILSLKMYCKTIFSFIDC